MTELVEGCRLKCADILLEHSRGSLWGWLIRLGTGSYWNHTLMVCAVRHPGQGHDTTLVVDPRMGGIHIRSIAHYLERLKSCDVAVKRQEIDWFQDESEAEPRYGKMVSDFASRKIDDKSVSMFALGSVRRVLRRLTLVYRFIRQRRKPIKPRKIRSTRAGKPLNVNVYSCSGFVQWSYYRGVARVVDRGGLDKFRLQQVIFNPRLVGEVNDHDLLSTTPADLANSNKLSWKYVIKNGVVWEVSREEEVNSILESGKG